MPLFYYHAITRTGKRKRGPIRADSIECAKERLREEGLLPTALTPLKKKRANASPRLLREVTREMHTLLHAGLPLYETAEILGEKYRNSHMHTLLLDISDRIKQGNQLSEILSDYPKIFSPIYIALVKAGEETGSLSESFRELAKFLENAEKAKNTITSIMVYPLFLIAFTLIILALLFFFLIPAMGELLEGRSLHPVTQCVVRISQMLQAHGGGIASGFALLLITSILFFRQKPGKRCTQYLTLHMPILQRLATETILSRFFRVLALLLRGGHPLPDSLSLAKATVKNAFLQGDFSRVESQVFEGKHLSEELQKSPRIPPLVIRLLAVGEKSGNIEPMAQRIADIYEESATNGLTRFIAFLQPTALLFLGSIVAMTLLSILLPLTDLSSIL